MLTMLVVVVLLLLLLLLLKSQCHLLTRHFIYNSLTTCSNTNRQPLLQPLQTCI